MILDGFVWLLKSALIAMIGWLPDPISIPAAVASSISSFAVFLQNANQILPVDTVFQIMALTFVVEFGILLFQFANWIANKLRGSG